MRAVVLAGQRAGVADPLATHFGVSHKCLAPIAGRPLIAHVVATLASHPQVDEVAICIEEAAFAAVEGAIHRPQFATCRIVSVAAAGNLADSVLAAAAGHHGPLLITTADNVLLTHDSVTRMARALIACDAALAMAPRAAVLAAHPDGQRRFYRFRDDAYSNCNLYGIANIRALAAAEVFRAGGQFAKKAHRIVMAFGPLNLVLLRLRLVSLRGALHRISRRLGLTLAPVILDDGSQAIDVDNERTFAVVEALLAKRQPLGPRSPSKVDDLLDESHDPRSTKLFTYDRGKVATP